MRDVWQLWRNCLASSDLGVRNRVNTGIFSLRFYIHAQDSVARDLPIQRTGVPTLCARRVPGKPSQYGRHRAREAGGKRDVCLWITDENKAEQQGAGGGAGGAKGPAALQTCASAD